MIAKILLVAAVITAGYAAAGSTVLEAGESVLSARAAALEAAISVTN